MAADIAPEYAKKPVLILGCGNVLFGDDGFGPATVEYMQRNCNIPRYVHVMDAGTGASRILFTLTLSELKPKKVIILDAVDLKRKPGEIFELPIDDLPKDKMSGFSFHQFPAVNLLKELRNTWNVDITIIACQIDRIPEVVKPGLSSAVKKSLPRAAKLALELAKILPFNLFS